MAKKKNGAHCIRPSQDDAKAEGFMDIAATFAAIVEAEKAHEARYRKLAQDVKNKTVFARPEAVLWRCGVCGYTLLAKEAPQKCPFCGNPQADLCRCRICQLELNKVLSRTLLEVCFFIVCIIFFYSLQKQNIIR